ncbi:CpaF family protein (plasmid) [Cupriavidus basilensis]
MIQANIIADAIARSLNPLLPFLEDEAVSEIMVNPGGRVFIERAGKMIDTGLKLPEYEIHIAIQAIAKQVRKDAVASTAEAIVDASLDGMRFAGAVAPTAPEGSTFSIRKHVPPEKRPTLEQLVARETLTKTQADLVTDLFIHQGKNLLVAGGTSSGKTTLANAFLGRLPKHERVITIEDARELNITVPNHVAWVANHQAGLTARLLVKLAMRFRPDRLILGETRGDDTYDLVRAMNSGHDGTLTTVHANGTEEALDAIEILFQQSLPPGAQFDARTTRRYLAKTIHLVVYAKKRARMLTDHEVGIERRVEQICLVKGVGDHGQYVLEEV